jgi:class 3 adenylate cyclase
VKQELDRRLVAVMFTDMVGYTALIEMDERVAIDKRDRYVGSVERFHDQFGGQIVQRLGDGTLSMFSSCLAAAQAAVEIQRDLSHAGVPARIGIHLGDVIVERERLTGEAVNIASRIESFAVPGAVVLSDAARDQLKNQSDVAMVSMGRFRLKNVGRPFELYAVSADGIAVPDPRDAPASRRRVSPRAGTPRRRYTRGKTRRPKLRGSIPVARIHNAHTPHTCRAKQPNIATVAARHGPLRRSFAISFFVSGVKFLGSRLQNRSCVRCRFPSRVCFLRFFFPILTINRHTYSFC